MTAKIIVVTNQKGGSGKTTLTMQLAGSMAERGDRVLIVDADPQGSAIRWSSSALENTPFPADVIGLSSAGAKVHQEIKKYTKKYDWIFVDCPPAIDSVAPQSALLVADLAIVPIIPSPPDLWAGIGIKELIERVQGLNDELLVTLVPNMCQTNVKLSKEALEVLKEFEMPITKTRLSLRTAYRQAAALGATVFAIGSSANSAIKEIKALREEIVVLVEREPTRKKSKKKTENRVGA